MVILPNSSKMDLTVSRSHIRTAFVSLTSWRWNELADEQLLSKPSSSSSSSSCLRLHYRLGRLSGVSTSRFVIQFLYSSLGAIWDIDSFLGAKNNLSEGESIIIVQHSIFIFILLLFYFLWIFGVHIQVEFTFIYLLMIHMIIHQSTSESNIYQKSSPTVLYIVSQ